MSYPIPFHACSLLLVCCLLIGCQSKSESDRGRTSPQSNDSESDGASGPEAVEPNNPAASFERRVPSIGLAPTQNTIPANVDPEGLKAEDPDQSFDLKLLAWNVESEGADPVVIAETLALLNHSDRYGIVGLTEVLPQAMADFRLALGKHYKYAYTKSGNNDRMQILFNEKLFEEVRHFELQDINIQGRYRAPLVVHLKRRSDELEFLVMINHLARGKAEIRQQQATQLVEWARDQTLPIIAIGDYNFDYVFETQQGNPAFVNFMRDNIWQWVKPESWIDTNWYDDPRTPDGKDDYPGSMLDFAFVANRASEWKRICRVIVRDNDFPDDETTSDHRPLELLIQVGE